jgi:ABC-type polysaccharide/polyol phosphate transport system ATPase subunit
MTLIGSPNSLGVHVSGISLKYPNMSRSESKHDSSFALKDITFDLNQGDSLAIIGANGSGKSTLMRVLAGIYKPSHGTVQISGSIAPLIELGAGFDPELSVKENVYLYGGLLGFERSYLKEHFDRILSYAELASYINSPVRILSSGMAARLAFSIVVELNSDILLIDEILSVGDERFQEKSRQKMEDIIFSGKILILVSHDANTLLKYTKKAILLQDGVLVHKGDTEEVLMKYRASN